LNYTADAWLWNVSVTLAITLEFSHFLSLAKAKLVSSHCEEMPLILATFLSSLAAQLLMAEQAMVLVAILKFFSCVVEYSHLLSFYATSTGRVVSDVSKNNPHISTAHKNWNIVPYISQSSFGFICRAQWSKSDFF
jgi:hypothetical protein